MKTTELLKLIKVKEQQLEQVANSSSAELDFLTAFYKNNTFGGIDGMLTMDLTDFTTAYIMSYITNDDREEAFLYIKKVVESFSGILSNTTEVEMDNIITICEQLSKTGMIEQVRDLLADSNRHRSKIKVKLMIASKLIDEEDLEYLFDLSERPNCNVAALFDLYCQVEGPLENALCIVHDMKSLRDDYDKFNQALEIYGPKSKERKYLIQSFKDDYDISEVSREFRSMRNDFEKSSKEFTAKKKTANKDLSLYRMLEQKIVQAIQNEEITDARKIISKITDSEIRLKVLQLIYEHNKDYYHKLIEEYNELSKNSTIHYQRLLKENNIEIDAQTIMHLSVQTATDMIARLKLVGIKEPKTIGEILQVTDKETFEKVIVYFTNGTLSSQTASNYPLVFNKDSDENKNLIINTRMIKEQGINPRNFDESQFIFIKDASIVQRNLEFLQTYSLEKSISKGLDYHFLLSDNLLERLDKMLELGLEQFLEEDLSILNHYKNINRIRVIRELNIPITSLDELKEILTTDQFLLADEDIMKYVEQIDPKTIKINDIEDDITRLNQYETTRTYNVNGVILSKNRIKRNYYEFEDAENKTLYSVLHNSIMTQTEYETLKQSLMNSLTYK